MCASGLPAQPRCREPDRRFSRNRHIRNGSAFREALRQRVAFVGKLMVLRLYRGSESDRRLGVIASKRTFRRAVDRNRAKRLIREAFRLHRSELKGRTDLVIVARRRILDVGLESVVQEFLALTNKARLLEDRP